MTLSAPALAEEDLLTVDFLLGRLAAVEPPECIELGSRREIDDVLHLRHHGDLVGAIRQVHALAGGADVVAVEVSGALLELAEIFDRAQRAFRSMDLLVE